MEDDEDDDSEGNVDDNGEAAYSDVDDKDPTEEKESYEADIENVMIDEGVRLNATEEDKDKVATESLYKLRKEGWKAEET